MVLAAVGLPLAGTATAGAVDHAASCRLVELTMPSDGVESGVMDIEVVDGTTVYYGNYQRPEADGSWSQHAVIWRGLDAEPEEVGPVDAPVNIAFELTAPGLVNGQAEYPDGTFRPWIQDITSGEITFLHLGGSAARDANGGRIRRINDDGATVGTLNTGKGRSKWNADVVGHDSPEAPLERLLSPGRVGDGWGINNLGERVGFVQHRNLPGAPHWALWLPTIWASDGSSRTAAMPGTDGAIFTIEDDGEMAGMVFVGTPESGHFEPIQWSDPDHYETLGVLEGGGWGRPFGADGEAQVGFLDLVADPAAVPEWALDQIWVNYGYYWERGMADSVRILPTLHTDANGVTDWREFHGVGAVHAVSTLLDQAATATHSGYAPDGSPTFAATVYLNVSVCGAEVATTHDPYHLTDLESAIARTEGAG
ncbi:hypothetical protein IDVR_11400 [Intrasporangium sp. DVR]